jgi:tetratricopeptide (TPR) repeat protein
MDRHELRPYAVFILLVIGAACRPSREGPSASKDAGGSFALVAVAPPRAPADLPTTDPAIAVGNLEGDIGAGEREVRHRASWERLVSLAELLLERGQYLGILRDYDRAAELAEEAVRIAGREGKTYLARAKTRAVFHRFADALDDLERADELLHDERASERQRASILQATGHHDEALAIAHRLTEERPSLATMGAEASILADMGDADRAERLFVEAEYHYRDVSPFPVAWLWFQRGLMWEKKGKPSRARSLYEHAYARLPVYAHVASHLASLESNSRAIERLRPIVARSDDPEYRAELGTLLRERGENGDLAAGNELVAEARARYEALMIAHPEAFADHAARFFLGSGAEPAKALAFAQQNLALRRTSDSVALVMDAAFVHHDAEAGCKAADIAMGLSSVTPSLRLLSTRAFEACGRIHASQGQLAPGATSDRL